MVMSRGEEEKGAKRQRWGGTEEGRGVWPERKGEDSRR